MVNLKTLFSILIILLIFSLIISGCVTPTLSNENYNERMRFIYEQDVYGLEYIRIYHDDINNVTCYTNKNGYDAGISCLKD